MGLPKSNQAADLNVGGVTRQSIELMGFDPERLTEIVSGARFDHHILTQAPCEVRHRRWALGSFSVDVGNYSFPTRVMGAFPRDRICIGYIRSMRVPVWLNGFQPSLSSIQLYSAGCELHYRAGAETEWVAIEFEEEALQSVALKRLGHLLEIPSGGVSDYQVPREKRATFDSLVERSMIPGLDASAMVEAILGMIVDLLNLPLGRTMAKVEKRWLRRNEMLKNADRYLKSKLADPFDGKLLAEAMGVTERSLQLHFLEAYGVTPGHWARCLALHRVRERLRNNEATLFSIEGIARDCGFRHMGRFSAYYQELFGEYPSETRGLGCKAGGVISRRGDLQGSPCSGGKRGGRGYRLP